MIRNRMDVREECIGKTLLIHYDPQETDEDGEDISEILLDNFEWEFNHLVQKKNPDGYFKIVGKNLGWDRREGYKYAEISCARELFNAISTLAESTISIYRYHNKGLFIRATNHDNPVNGDQYYLVPVAYSTYAREQCS